MKNFIQDGQCLTVTAAAAVASGEGFLVGSLFLVACADAGVGESVAACTVGVFELPKAAVGLTAGEAVYWDAVNGEVTNAANKSGKHKIGVATAAAGAGVALVKVRLDGVSTAAEA